MNFLTPRFTKRTRRRGNNFRPSEENMMMSSSERPEPVVTGKITKRTRRRVRENGSHIG